MSNVVSKRVIIDGTKAVVYIYLESDGVEGELTNYVLIDPRVDLATTWKEGGHMSVTQIWHSFSGFDALIKFADLNPVPSWNLTSGSINYSDFRYFGGLIDVSGIDTGGKVLLSTRNFAPVGTIGTLVIELKKRQ